MKTLHTIYTNFAKRILIAIALITMSVGNAWGTSYISYNDNVQDASTTISSSNVNNGSAGAISWTGADCNYSDKRVNIAANGSITFTVSGDNEITKIVVTSGSSTEYYGTWTSTSGSVSSTSGVTTISGINSNSVTITTSTAFRCTSASTIKIYYTQDTGGGVVNCNGTYDFTKIDGLNTWGTSYSKRTVEYLDATVTFSEASKQTETITDQPVTKGNDVSLVMTDGSTLSSVTWVCQQWSDKSQTITLHYSTNGGQSYTTTGVTSSNFTISSNNLPVGTNAVKITFSSSKNQVGITSCTIEKVCGPTETTITLHPNGGTPNENQEITTEEESYTLPECPFSRTGYTFDGWATSANDNVIYENKETIENLNGTAVNLYAKWTPIQYDITYNLYGGTNHASNPAKYTIETSIITLKAPTKTGYTFDGWYKENTFDTSVTQIANGSTGDITLYAKWTINSYSTRWKLAGGQLNGNSNDIVQDYEFGQAITAPTGIERVGFNFIGWEPTVPTTMPAENLEFTAQWEEKPLINYRTLCTYDIVLKNNYVDDDSKDGYTTITATHTSFSTANKPAAREGYEIEGYYAEPECTIKVADNNGNLMDNVTNYTDAGCKWIGGETILYTKWTGRTYTVTLDDNGGSGGSGTITATYGSPMPAITLPTRTGYTFNGYWTGKTTQSTQYYDANGNSLKNWDKAGNTTILYALWTANTNTSYVVKHYKEQLDGTYPTEANDIDNLTGTTASSVTPAVKLYEGFTAPSTQTVSIAADGSTVVIYKYTRNSYNLSWDVNSGDALTGEYTSGSVKYGASITQPNTPTRIGYTFANWSPEVPATMPAGDATYTAQWQLIQYTITWSVGGSTTTSIVSVETPLSLPTSPANEALGCCADAFIGWSVYAQPTKEQVFNDVANAPAIDGNKTFHAVFATTILTEGSATATFNEMGYTNAEKVTEIALGDGEGHGDATILFAKEQSAPNYPAYYTASGALHAYAKNTITINSTSATSTITNVQFTFAAKEDGSNTISANVGTYADGIWTGTAESVVFTIGGETGHRKITSITVTTQAVEQYTNYVTKCTYGNSPTLGAATVTYNSGDGIDVRCEQTSAMNSAATLTFPNAADLTCPITLTASEGFLISTSKSNDAGYQTSLTVSPYKSGSAQAGKLRTIYIRANAAGKTENYSGTITILKTEGEEETKSISITANVNCQSYTLKTVDHLGTETVVGNYYAGQIIEEAPKEPKKDDCSTKYTFDGWSTSEVEYGSLVYNKVTFPFTMPAENVTLIPVYRLLEDVDKADYHRVTSDLGANNWAGDYLIAAEKDGAYHFADGAAENIGIAESEKDLTVYDNIVFTTDGDQYFVKLIAVDYGYVLQSKSEKYNYINNNDDSGLSGTVYISTAMSYPLTVTFDDGTKTVSIANRMHKNAAELQYTKTSKCFRFYTPGNQTPIYLYKKSPLYTSSLICEEITAEDAMVTSTVDQTVKVNVTATMSGMTVIRDRTLTVESDNTDFAATITETATNTYNVAVNYKPSAEDDTDGTETATITIKVNNNPVTTFQVTGRHLPENFVIAAKWGDNWYALPANCVNSGDSKQGILIDVNDINNPTSATAPTTTKYGLRSVKPGRQADFGQSILFTERVSDNQQRALFQNSEETENIWVSAQYENYDGSNPTYYEWIPSTNDLTNYTFTHSASSRKLGVNENGVFGAYTTDVQVRLLTATFYEQVAVQVIKWKANSVIVMYTGAETTATTQIDTNTATDAQTLANQKITHGIYELTTNQSLTANAGKILTMCFGTTQVKVEVPLIVSEEVIASANGHDVVILNGGKLKAATTSYSYNTIYVYGGGKLAIPESAQLGVNNIILRAGGVATNDAGQEATYQYIYPQVDLKGTLTATSQTFLKYEYVTDYDHWYHLVLPFNASFNTITYPQEYYGDNVSATNTGSWQIKRYDGATRATGNYDAWKDIEKDEPKVTQVLAGKGYIYWGAPKKVTIGGDTQRQKWGIQRITMNKQAATAKNEENGNKKISGLSSYANVANNSGADNDQGWNLVGNPYMVNLTDMATAGLHACKLVEVIDPATGKWNGKWEWNNETDIRYLTIPSNHFDTYTAKTVAQTVPLVAGRAFFVQLEGEANGITFATANRASLMPALLAENDDKPVDIETGIVLSNETLQDEMNFWIKDGKTNDYEYNADYPKTPNNNRFNIYGVHTNGDLSWVAISPEFAAESMPIGYQVPAAGTYMLSLSETYYSDDLQALYVTDHGVIPEVTTDLLSGSYEFSVNQAETNNERFTVSIILKTEEDDGGGDVSTGVDNTTNNNTPCKFIYQDKMYILRNGVIYDAMGKQVQTINK